ncbi:zinc finger CCCH-type antiviral protein 1-like isoform X2 [Mixophyes fleayi]|uniref:zinc finger CCCH-type antiviral protein 1-like isoform X2 n=1 Tax=Mixophyes fleayi TaxID=3061075 RepID=UPI003F4D7BBE
MSDPTVTAYLTKLLCSHNGRLPKDELTGLLELAPEQIEQILQHEPQRFPQVGDLVLAQSPVRICPRYLKSEEEAECGRLHLCRYHLQGKCWPGKRPQCLFSHDILSNHNLTVLKANEISGLNDDELKVLLLQNDNQLLPEICRKYLHATCDQGNACTRLHACGFFTQGECSRRTCQKSHHLLEAGPDLLLHRCRLSFETVQNFQMLCDLKHNQRLLAPRAEPRQGMGRGARGAARGRGRGRPRNRTRNGSRGRSQNRSQDGKTDGTGPNVRGRTSSRPVSECGESQRCSSGEDEDDDDDDDDYGRQKTTQKLMNDWFTSETPSSGNAQVGSLVFASTVEKPPDKTGSAAYVGQPLTYYNRVNSPNVLPVPSYTPLPNPAPATAKPTPSATSNIATEPRKLSSEQLRPSNVPPTSGRLNATHPSTGQSNIPATGSANLYPSPVVGSNKPVISPTSATANPSSIDQLLANYRTTSNPPTCSNPPTVPSVRSITPLPNPVPASAKPTPSTTSNIATETRKLSSEQLRPSNVPPTSGRLNATHPSVGQTNISATGSANLYPSPVVGSNKPVISPTSATANPLSIDQLLANYRTTSNPPTCSNPPTVPPVRSITPLPNPVPASAKPTPSTTSNIATETRKLSSEQLRPSNVPPTSGRLNATHPSVGQTKISATGSANLYSSPVVGSNKPVISPTSAISNTFMNPTAGPSSTQPNPISVSSNLFSDLNNRPAVPPRGTSTVPVQQAHPLVGGTSTPRTSVVYSDLSRLSDGYDSLSSKLEARVKPMSRADTQYATLQLQPSSNTSLNKPTLVSSSDSKPGKVPDICLSNIWKYCKLGGKCPDMHFYLPYRWQVCNGIDWEDVQNMENVEKAYSDPKVIGLSLVDFEAMKFGSRLVRRLSTPSSVTKNPEYVLTTEWIWYWKDETGNWIQYGQANIKNVSSTILSADLESIYLSDPAGIIPFTAGQQQYEINFREMKQRNIIYRTEKEVRRRPKFQSFEDVKMLKGRKPEVAHPWPSRMKLFGFLFWYSYYIFDTICTCLTLLTLIGS